MGLCPKTALLLLISQALFATFSGADLAPEALTDPRIRVVILNALATPILVHCNSKDTDLGDQVIAFNRTWQFSFKPNIWGTTRFSCKFAWGTGQITHFFDIFAYDRDISKCHNCVWKILSSGPCRLKENTIDADVCYKWK